MIYYGQWSGIKILSRPVTGRDYLHPGRNRYRVKIKTRPVPHTGISVIPAGTGIFPIFISYSVRMKKFQIKPSRTN